MYLGTNRLFGYKLLQLAVSTAEGVGGGGVSHDFVESKQLHHPDQIQNGGGLISVEVD